MDQNGSFYMSEGLGSEEGDYINDFENSSLRKQHLQNGHHKRLKKPRDSVQEFEKLERFFGGENGSLADNRFEVDQDYQSDGNHSISRDSILSGGRSDSAHGEPAESSSRHSRRDGMNNGSVSPPPSSLASSRGGLGRRHRLTNGFGHHNNGSFSDEDDEISSLSDHGGPPGEGGLGPSPGVDMMKYMEETPRRASPRSQRNSPFEEGGDPYDSLGDHSLQSNNTNSNNNKNSLIADRTANPSIRSDINVISLSKEEPPSHFQQVSNIEDATDEDPSDIEEVSTPAGLEAAIRAAASNVEEFKSRSDKSKENPGEVGPGWMHQDGAINGWSGKLPGRSSEDSRRESRHQSVTEESMDSECSTSGREVSPDVASHRRTPISRKPPGRGSPGVSHLKTGLPPRQKRAPPYVTNDMDEYRDTDGSIGDGGPHRGTASNSSAKSSGRSSIHSRRGSRHSSASEDVEPPGELPYQKSYRGTVGNPLRDYTSEAAAFRERRSTKIPELNLGQLTDTDKEAESDTPRSKAELSSRLSEERQTRRQAAQVNHELQREYDELLAKYAQAENTIDQLRLGAKVNLYSDPSQRKGRKHSRDGASRNVSEAANQTDAQDLRDTIANLSQQVPLLERAIATSQVPPEDQQALFDKLKQAHGQLEEEYLQRMEAAQERQRWDSVLLDSTEDQFDPERSLEGEIFQVGMQLEDLQEKVQENLRSNPPLTPSRHSTSQQQSNSRDIPAERLNTTETAPEYNRLLQKYEALKQLPGTPKRDQEIQKLVKELDDLQITPEEQIQQRRPSDRSELSDVPSSHHRSVREKSHTPSSGRGSHPHSPSPSIEGGRGDQSQDDSSGRGTPSSARSLEGRKITKERKSRIPKKTLSRSLPRLDTKRAAAATESGSSPLISPEYEDSGFVGSEGSRQSQHSKPGGIPQTIPLSSRIHSYPDGTDGARLNKRTPHYHTPIQELSERGQSSTSETRRRSRTPRKALVATTSEEDDYGGSVERPVRLTKRPPASSKSPRPQHLIASPLPSKLRVEDFQRKSPPAENERRQRTGSSPRTSPKDSEGGRSRSGLARSLEEGRPRTTEREARQQPFSTRRNSDVPSSASKRSGSAKSEEMRVLRAEIAGLKQQLQPPKRQPVKSSERGSRARSISIGTEDGIRSHVGDEERLSGGQRYLSEDQRSLDQGSRGRRGWGSTRSGRSAGSEQLQELRDEMDQLREEMKAATDERGRARNREVAGVAPSATSTPNARSHHRGRDGRGREDRTRSLERLPPREDRETPAASALRRGIQGGSLSDGRYRRRAPSLDRRAPTEESREDLRETLRRTYVPMSDSYSREGRMADHSLEGGNAHTRSKEFGHMERGGMPALGGNAPPPAGVDYNQSLPRGYQNYQPLSSMEAHSPVNQSVGSSQQQRSPLCQHCNGSGVNHNHNSPTQHGHPGTIHTQQSPPPMQQAPMGYTRTSPNGTYLVPQGSPVYHSTPAVVPQHGTPVHVIQAPHSSLGPPVAQSTSSIPIQQAAPGTVVRNVTVETSPQGSHGYTNQPVTVLGPGTHQIYVPPQNVAVQSKTVTLQPQVVTVPAQTVLVQPEMVTVPAQNVMVQPQSATVPAQTVAVNAPQSVSPQQGVSASDSAVMEGARPVYLVPSSKGRYYVRDEPTRRVQSDVEEIVYRRTPVKKSPRRKSCQVEWHSEMEADDLELDDSLYAACQMAQRLKRSSERVLESVQGNLQRSARKLDYH